MTYPGGNVCEDVDVYGNFALMVAHMFWVYTCRRLISGRRDSSSEKMSVEVKQSIFQSLLKPSQNTVKVLNDLSSNFELVEQHLNEVREGLRHLGYNIIDVSVRLETPLIVGIGSGSFESVFEVGISWDYLFDLPYIPGSSIKGAMRSWCIRRCVDSASNKKDCVKNVIKIFGATKGSPFHRREREWIKSLLGDDIVFEEPFSGNIMITDAYPIRSGEGIIRSGLLEPDITNPHYYRGGEAVEDEFSVEPNPITYLVVAPKTVFRFVLGVKNISRDIISSLSRDLFGRESVEGSETLISLILLAALGEGVGAKTSKGYGVLRLDRVLVARSVGRSRGNISGESEKSV